LNAGGGKGGFDMSAMNQSMPGMGGTGGMQGMGGMGGIAGHGRDAAGYANGA
jgi:hypothetical protein